MDSKEGTFRDESEATTSSHERVKGDSSAFYSGPVLCRHSSLANRLASDIHNLWSRDRAPSLRGGEINHNGILDGINLASRCPPQP